MAEILVQLIINSCIAGAIYMLVTIGFNLIYGATKFFNITHGVMTAIGAYTVFFFAKQMDWHVVIAVILGVCFAGGIGWLLDRIIYRPLRKRKASNLVLLVASLGAFFAIQAVLSIAFTSNFQTLVQNVGTQKTFSVLGGAVSQTQVIIIITAIAVVVSMALLLKYTMFGKAVRAVSDDVEVAKVIGINTDRIIGITFLIGSAIAGLAGILVGFDTAIEPTMGLVLLLKGVIASIVGGVGNLYGGVLGSMLLGFVENFGIWKLSGEWKDAIAFILLIVFLLFRPKGIINK